MSEGGICLTEQNFVPNQIQCRDTLGKKIYAENSGNQFEIKLTRDSLLTPFGLIGSTA